MLSSLVLQTKNPFNIRYSDSNNWLGAIAGKNLNGFAVFVDRIYGLRAGFILLRNYMKNGHSSVCSIISRYAPASDGNNTNSYIDFVEAGCIEHGLDPNRLVLNDTTLFEISRRMLKIECGFDLFLTEFSYVMQRFDIKL